MNVARQTDERLRYALNADQPSRERLCMALLALDRNFSNIKPRRPDGGPDGGRDIECTRGPNLCFGAVGFINNVADSPENKRAIKKKFAEDLEAAIENNRDLKAFIFFTNVDLTPTEIKKLKQSAENRGISFVDIYWRERIRHALDSPEGLAIRYQYLSIPLSEAEQAAFFSRFGKDLEGLLTGRFDRLEEKIDFIEFCRWQTGNIRSIGLDIIFKKMEESYRNESEHFRACFELQSVTHEQRSIIFGGQDDHWKTSSDGQWVFGTKTFFFREQFGKIEESWMPQGPRIGGGLIDGVHFGIKWIPVSPILAAQFDNLSLHFHFTENLTDRIAKVNFTIDSYMFVDREIKVSDIRHYKPSLGWPSPLTKEQEAIKWQFYDFGRIAFNELPKKEREAYF